ncbi:MAG: class I SAM-dependent methyltransferase [Kocuria sp.]|uniref:class I SAM-dependent methyltransferase n=1 Tax=Kocuria sp. WRN011 TaxID=2029858 RepID=UPI00117A5E4C|nr:class I SAM-dependent methyltransferase [Kocuria sp. WRN011]MDN5699623.1 class I SAM-dependent methyltransferase [Kocuria sp.]
MNAIEYNGVYAKNYDALTGGETGAGPTVDMLCQVFEGAQNLLEIGVGTGRVALPLARRGFQVSGTEISPHMVERLNAKLQADSEAASRVHTRLIDLSEEQNAADLYDLRSDGAYVSLGSMCCISDDDDLLMMLRQVRTLVPEGGRLAIEAYSPLYFRTHVPDNGLTTMLPLDQGGQARTVTNLVDGGRAAELRTTITHGAEASKAGTMTEKVTLRGPQEYSALLKRAGWNVLVWDEEDGERGLYWILADAAAASGPDERGTWTSL